MSTLLVSQAAVIHLDTSRVLPVARVLHPLHLKLPNALQKFGNSDEICQSQLPKLAGEKCCGCCEALSLVPRVVEPEAAHGISPVGFTLNPFEKEPTSQSKHQTMDNLSHLLQIWGIGTSPNKHHQCCSNKTSSLDQGYLSQNRQSINEWSSIGMMTVHPSLPDLKQLYQCFFEIFLPFLPFSVPVRFKVPAARFPFVLSDRHCPSKRFTMLAIQRLRKVLIKGFCGILVFCCDSII